MIKKKYSSAFKAKVALEAIKENDTISAIALRYQIHPNCVSNWKAEALANIPNLFEGKKKSESDNINDLIALERKVGQLIIENDFLKKNWMAYSKRSAFK